MFASLVKYWPILMFGLNVATVWVCWSLRQVAKEQVEKQAAAWGVALAKEAEDLAQTDKEIAGRVDECESRLDKLETTLKAMPTKADLAKVEGELHGLQRLMENVEKGVARIEGFMMERSK